MNIKTSKHPVKSTAPWRTVTLTVTMQTREPISAHIACIKGELTYPNGTRNVRVTPR